jgi:hypothetical protein
MSTTPPPAKKTLDAGAKQEVQYCIPLWLRDQQVLSTIRRPAVGRIESHEVRKGESVAIVCFGPSLQDTYEQLRGFKTIITVSGAHKFLAERGFTTEGRAWYHVEVDPREHKIALLGPPQPGVVYMPASCCHPKYFDHLEAAGATVRTWHVFDNSDEANRILPRGEWAITGGCNVGLRAMTIARFFGFLDQHIFGMDGCEGKEPGKKHAAAHPLQDGTGHNLCEFPPGSGKMWRTTPSMLESARQTWHELDMMGDVTPTFYGAGLVQEMSKTYKPNPTKGSPAIAMAHPALISDEYRKLNRVLHEQNLFYGVGGGKHVDVVKKLAASLKSQSVLDYGCGKSMLAAGLDFPIWEYDPAIPGKDALPRPADLVVCTDVLEHIEPEHLSAVLMDLRRCTRRLGYFVIHTGPASKTLPDGRNTHLLQRDQQWWTAKLSRHFTVGKILAAGPLLHVVVSPLKGQSMTASARAAQILEASHV